MSAELCDTLALMTGASGGIGRAAALELARRGADVAIHFHRNETGAALTAERVAALGGKAATFGGDLSRREGAAALVAAVLARFGNGGMLMR
jgi:NAD(P)-dependent dehydrogenase (short-subunit alcohol dehydrogenase family)